MFIPLYDANTLRHVRLQFVTIGLIVANVIVFLLTSGFDGQQAAATTYGLGYIPAVFHDHVPLDPSLVLVPDEMTLITYAFLHGDLMHLGGNMLFLWVFGDNVEDAMGHFRFLVFYLLCAAAGAYAHGLVDTASEVPLIGASGAVAGIIGAYLMLHPKVKVWVLAFMRIPIRLPAWIVLGFWIAFQVFMFVAVPDDLVSWAAHVGGALAGIVLVVFFKRRAVPLFDRTIVRPDAVVVEGADTASPPEPTIRSASKPASQSGTKPSPWGRAGVRRKD